MRNILTIGSILIILTISIASTLLIFDIVNTKESIEATLKLSSIIIIYSTATIMITNIIKKTRRPIDRERQENKNKKY